MKELLEKRKEIKRKKPSFQMQDSHKLSRLKKKWRKPKGIDSKMRLNLKGYSKKIQVGYKSPKQVRGLDKTGLIPVSISSLNDLKGLTKEKHGLIISSTVGKKKKIEILKKIEGYTILNIKDVTAYIKKVEEELQKRKEQKKKLVKKKEEKKDKKKEKKTEDKLADKVLNEEEKAQQEKKEKDKILTKAEK